MEVSVEKSLSHCFNWLNNLRKRSCGGMPELELMVTMWPSFPHFKRFSTDKRISAVRLNTAMYDVDEIDDELKVASSTYGAVPFYFDIKGRQLRVVESFPFKDRLELIINHPIKVPVPTEVLFKAGADRAILKEVTDGGHRLIFDGGPEYLVYEGESLHLRHPEFEAGGDSFCAVELEKLEKAKRAGINKFFLSYVRDQRYVDEFMSIAGRDVEVVLKVEDLRGLRFVSEEFSKTDNISLMAARGDLYVELKRPHHIMSAMKLIIEKDARALVGSRIMLSVVREPTPECADFLELAWMYDLGYRRMMLCDEICLKEGWLSTAVDAFDCFRSSYIK
jgi:pyruvate kinase